MTDFIDLLLRMKSISSEMAHLMRQYSERWNLSQYESLLRTHLFTEEELADFLAHSLKIDRVYHVALDEERQAPALEMLTFSQAIQDVILVFFLGQKKGYEAIFADPTQRSKIDHLRQKHKGPWTFSVAEKSAIQKAIKQCYPIDQQLI